MIRAAIPLRAKCQLSLSFRALAVVALLGGHPRECSLQQKWSGRMFHMPGLDEAYAAKVGALIR